MVRMSGMTNTRFCNDMKKCKDFLHTGKLESFHSMKLQYLPKSTGFTMKTSIVLTMLAVMQNNEYQRQAPLAKKMQVAHWSRASKKYVAKTRTIYDNVAFKKEIIAEMNDNISSNTRLPLDLSAYVRTAIPKTFHGEKAPPREELLLAQRTRLEEPWAYLRIYYIINIYL